MSLDKVLPNLKNIPAEWVAGIKKTDLEKFVELPESGFVEVDEDKLCDFLATSMEFRERTDEMEKDSKFVQIIPYVSVINEKGEVYSSVRKVGGNESRLHGQRVIAFGGHLAKNDVNGKMIDWLKREIEEEIEIENLKSLGFFGLIYDGGSLGGTHLGLFFEAWVRGGVKIRETDKFEEGKFFGVNDLVEYVKEMETWSVIALKNL